MPQRLDGPTPSAVTRTARAPGSVSHFHVPELNVISNGDRTVRGSVDIPLASMDPPLTEKQIREQGFMLVHFPNHETTPTPVTLINGPQGPAIRVSFPKANAGELLKMPITLGIGTKEAMSQSLQLPNGEIAPMSSPRFRAQVLLGKLSVDRTTDVVSGLRTQLADSRAGLAVMQDSVDALKNGTQVAMARRQLDTSLDAAVKTLSQVQTAHDEIREQLMGALRSPPSERATLAWLGADGLWDAWIAFQKQPGPQTRQAWETIAARALDTASDPGLRLALESMPGADQWKTLRTQLSNATLDVESLKRDVERNDEMQASIAKAVPQREQTLISLRSNSQAIETELQSYLSGRKDVVTEPTSYDAQAVL